MTKSIRKQRNVYALVFLFAIFLIGCAPTPNDEQIRAAILASLEDEKKSPELAFEEMEVPIRFTGKAGAVLQSKDKKIQRNYWIEYDAKLRTFVVAKCTTSHLCKHKTYSASDNGNFVVTEYAEHFNFSDDDNEHYLIVYVGRGKKISELRTRFESEKLKNISLNQLAEFEECDLGGDVMILIVPRYKGLSVWINELNHTHGEHMESGKELARFGDKPVYLFCKFAEKRADYEVHISFDGLGQSFLTSESLLKRLEQN